MTDTQQVHENNCCPPDQDWPFQDDDQYVLLFGNKVIIPEPEDRHLLKCTHTGLNG